MVVVLGLVVGLAGSAWCWWRAMACVSVGAARRESRRAGAWSAATSLGAGLLVLAGPPWAPVHGPLRVWILVALLAAAATSILGGLSGKPRPSGQVALSLLAIGVGLLLYGLLVHGPA